MQPAQNIQNCMERFPSLWISRCFYCTSTRETLDLWYPIKCNTIAQPSYKNTNKSAKDSIPFKEQSSRYQIMLLHVTETQSKNVEVRDHQLSSSTSSLRTTLLNNAASKTLSLRTLLNCRENKKTKIWLAHNKISPLGFWSLRYAPVMEAEALGTHEGH
jgi:hypothetical protein